MTASGERKEKETKELLSQTQRVLLAQFLAPPAHELYPDGGILVNAIRESKEPNLGTRLLYLERAMTQTPDEFNGSLDKLYSSHLTEQEKTERLELIRSYKFINSLCCKGEMKYVVDVPAVQLTGSPTGDMQAQNYGTISVIKHTFAHLGEAVNEEFISSEAKKMVAANIGEMKEKNKNKEKEMADQREERLKAEEKMIQQTEWRNLLDLPPSQLPASAVSEQALPAVNADIFNMGIGAIRGGEMPGRLDFSASLYMDMARARSDSRLGVDFVFGLYGSRYLSSAPSASASLAELYRGRTEAIRSLVTDRIGVRLPPPLFESKQSITDQKSGSPPAVAGSPTIAPHASLFQSISADEKKVFDDLSKITGIIPTEIWEMKRNNPHHYSRLDKLQRYINSAEPPSLTLEQAYATTDQERDNLDRAYPYILKQRMTIEEARNLTEEDRALLAPSGTSPTDEQITNSLTAIEERRTQQREHSRSLGLD